MRLLLDSNAFYWLLYKSEKVGRSAIHTVTEADTIAVSVVTLWEFAIKYSNGGFSFSPEQLLKGVDQLGATIMHIEPGHLLHYPDIQLAHRDPFDRLLIAQAEAEGMVFMTADKQILASQYAVQDVRL